MCGIAGIFNYKTAAPADASLVQQMCQRMAHRGPDAGGVRVSGSVGLGHRRLSILDLSERGRQPMFSADGRFAITYNGEVYNYLELRSELEADGYSFKTDTDTEVLLAAYERFGVSALSRFNGMFAFAIWDAAERTMLVARDRVGIKPLYYAETPDGLVFASEAKALFLHPAVRAEVSPDDLKTYMAFGYVPGRTTLFRGVRKLPPGHVLTIDHRGASEASYWDVVFAPDHSRSEAETARGLHELLLDAVKIHLRSDVPLGVFLSGGLDSSAMVSLLAEAGVSGLKTFSIAYDDGPAFDETKYAQLVADRFATEHHVLRLDADQFAGFIPGYVWHMDEPVTEAAAISLYFVSKLLREHVIVALSGEGADELFGGYQIYRYMQWLETYRRIPAGIRSALEPIIRAFAPGKVRRYLQMARLPLAERYFGVSLPDTVAAGTIYSDDFRRQVRGGAADVIAPFYAHTAGLDPLSRMLYADLKTWLVDDLLIKADKMTMANAVELRVPFLDYRVVEYAATIPSAMKIRGGVVKSILKKAMAGRLPTEIIEREKMGFPTPLSRMFRADMSGYLRDLLLDSRATGRGYFVPSAVARLIEEHQRGVQDHHKLLWQLTVLEEWHRVFIDSAPAAP